MQCVSCRFENTPDSQNCCRCGTNLDLDGIALDVHPPRAKKWNKTLRKFVPRLGIGRAWKSMRSNLTPSATIVEGMTFPISLLLRGLIPGGAHFLLGQRRNGWFFRLLFLLFLLLGVLLFGSFLGNACLGLAFSVHASSLMHIVQQQQSGNMLGRIARGYIVVIFLGFCVYFPLGWMLSNLAGPRVIEVNAPPLLTGDVYLCNHWAYWQNPPKAGDVVLFNGQVGTAYDPGNRNQPINIQAGDRIDRILAGPDDQVQCKKGKLIVNGQPAEWLPLNPAALSYDWTIKVPPQSYCILPSTLLAVNQRMMLNQNHCIVSEHSIRARVYFQLQPLGHFGFMH